MLSEELCTDQYFYTGQIPKLKSGPSILPAHWQALHGFKTDVPRIIQPVLHLFLLSLLPPSAFLTQVCNESVVDDVLTRAQLVQVSIGVTCIEYSSTHNPYISPCYNVPRVREKRRTNQLLGASCSASCHVPCFLLQVKVQQRIHPQISLEFCLETNILPFLIRQASTVIQYIINKARNTKPIKISGRIK